MGYFMIQKVSHKTFKVQTNNYVRTKKTIRAKINELNIHKLCRQRKKE